jgi:hypothetical protein
MYDTKGTTFSSCPIAPVPNAGSPRSHSAKALVRGLIEYSDTTGSRGMLIWKDDVHDLFETVIEPEPGGSWGTFAVVGPEQITSNAEAAEYLQALLPVLRERWEAWKILSPKPDPFPMTGVTLREASVCVTRSRACASLLRSAAPSRLALPPSPPQPLGAALAARPQGREPHPYSRVPDWGRGRPGHEPRDFSGLLSDVLEEPIRQRRCPTYPMFGGMAKQTCKAGGLPPF